jgi:hypothetical protein
MDGIIERVKATEQSMTCLKNKCNLTALHDNYMNIWGILLIPTGKLRI